VIPGPGGHSTVLARSKEDDPTRYSLVSVETLSDQYFRAPVSERWKYNSSRNTGFTASVINGRIINVGGWVVNDIDKGMIPLITARYVAAESTVVTFPARFAYGSKFVVRQNDATRQTRGTSRRDSASESPWVGVMLPQFGVGSDSAALCPGGIIVSLDSDLGSSGSPSTVSARKAI